MSKHDFLPPPDMRRIKRIHFVGIGGSGMCGIAEVLLNQGYLISGSDIGYNANIERLENIGAIIFHEHKADNIDGADVVVNSSAIDFQNIEIKCAHATGVPVVRRAEMLAELMRYRHGIAVAGTHGKTTTTSLIAAIFAEDGRDPTFVVGGRVNSAGTNARLGASKYLVAEADESDASFLHLQPMVAVVTNIEADHMQNYDYDFERLKNTFIEFLHNLPFYGLAILCTDDIAIRSMLTTVSRPKLTYGFNIDAQYRLKDLSTAQSQCSFVIDRPEGLSSLSINLGMPGRHNALNAAAAIAVASDEGICDSSITEGLRKFRGVGRRFEILGNYAATDGNALLVDDYGHHPTEVSATIDAVRDGWPERRLIMVFQPHRYSRTKDFYDEFVDVLCRVDELLILDIYAAGEESIPCISSSRLVASIETRGIIKPVYVEHLETVPALLNDIIRNKDIVLTQGAGSVSKLVAMLQEVGGML